MAIWQSLFVAITSSEARWIAYAADNWPLKQVGPQNRHRPPSSSQTWPSVASTPRANFFAAKFFTTQWFREYPFRSQDCEDSNNSSSCGEH
ncbi:hypothetical protein Mapa_004266 [Marchantia paleacea]|nr:hypothetical protein Mapa_004266 [Marchantia paleacea]